MKSLKIAFALIISSLTGAQTVAMDSGTCPLPPSLLDEMDTASPPLSQADIHLAPFIKIRVGNEWPPVNSSVETFYMQLALGHAAESLDIDEDKLQFERDATWSVFIRLNITGYSSWPQQQGMHDVMFTLDPQGEGTTYNITLRSINPITLDFTSQDSQKTLRMEIARRYKKIAISYTEQLSH
ncbi:MAG: hypothetical protein LBJ92_04140 [Holosporales bacterium]|jgi:hypothetical protein|nr:hypothetical protein [Holosporales bacterium]